MKKKIIIIIVVFVILIAGLVLFLSRKKGVDRSYQLLEVNEYLYYPLEVKGKYGILKKDGTVVINPEYDDLENGFCYIDSDLNKFKKDVKMIGLIIICYKLIKSNKK